MNLSVNLLHNIQKKLKQPYNTVNLELSYSLCNNEFYYIDSYLKYNLTQIGEYKIYKVISSEVMNKALEFKLFKYLSSFGVSYNYYDYLFKIVLTGNSRIFKSMLANKHYLNKSTI